MIVGFVHYNIALIVSLVNYNTFEMNRNPLRALLSVLIVPGSWILAGIVIARIFLPGIDFHWRAIFNHATIIMTTLLSSKFPLLWNLGRLDPRVNFVKASNYFALRECPNIQNGHIRLPNPFYNISMVTPGKSDERSKFWNPTIVALPSWAENQYIIVSMVAAPESGAGRKNMLCEANICQPTSSTAVYPREKHCTDEDIEVLGSNGGLRCVTTPIEVDLPFTPARNYKWPEQQHCADIRGFQVS
jgi:hypothetical protein